MHFHINALKISEILIFTSLIFHYLHDEIIQKKIICLLLFSINFIINWKKFCISL
jgi:hypothetical protein